MMVADKFPNGLIGLIGLRIIRTIGTIRRRHHFPIFPINSTSISKKISCQKGLGLVYHKRRSPRDST